MTGWYCRVGRSAAVILSPDDLEALEETLEGYWSARRGAYRLVYRIDDGANKVRLVRVDHRADVYRSG